jgi:hypothetical protein
MRQAWSVAAGSPVQRVPRRDGSSIYAGGGFGGVVLPGQWVTTYKIGGLNIERELLLLQILQDGKVSYYVRPGRLEPRSGSGEMPRLELGLVSLVGCHLWRTLKVTFILTLPVLQKLAEAVAGRRMRWGRVCGVATEGSSEWDRIEDGDALVKSK